jgi:predicted metal-dependent phosphoesterase TrpH
MSWLCDLHMHSSASDGLLGAEALVDAMAAGGVRLMALTDHDDVSAVARAQEHAARIGGIEVLPGVEVTVAERGGEREMHVLGLGIDPGDARLAGALAGVREARERRGRAMVERLAAHRVALDREQVRSHAERRTVGRPHVARALVAAGACADEEEAFARWLRRGRPAYEPSAGMDLAGAIASIHAAGGIALLAHPPRSRGVDAPGGLEAFVRDAARAGLDGLEVQHPAHTPAQMRKLRRLCRELDLVESGGSDFHGNEGRELRPGRGRGNLRLGPALAEAIQARIARRRGVSSPAS